MTDRDYKRLSDAINDHLYEEFGGKIVESVHDELSSAIFISMTRHGRTIDDAIELVMAIVRAAVKISHD